MTVNTSIFSGNEAISSIPGLVIGPAGGSGGGLDNSLWGLMTISNSTICDNVASYDQTSSAKGYGGGLTAASGSTTTVTNCTFASNSAALYGGGIFQVPPASGSNSPTPTTLTVINSTISGNSATNGGGGIYVGGLGPSIGNTIIAANTAQAGPDVLDGVTSLGYNLIDNTSGSSGFSAPGDQLNVNPLLGPLAANGGPTQTMALVPGSPAIGAGSVTLIPIDPTTGQPMATDQRGTGYQRTVNVTGTATVDIGAFQTQQQSTTATVNSSASASVSGQSVTFAATVTPQSGSAVPVGSIQFEIDGTNFGSPVPLVNGSATSPAISSLSIGSHTISALYTSDSTADFGDSTGSASIAVDSLTPTNLGNVIAAAQSSGGTVTLVAADTNTLTNTLTTITSLAANTSGAVVVDLSSNTTYQQQDGQGNTIPIDASAPSGTTLTVLCSTGNATVYDLQATGGNVDIHGSPNGTLTIIGMSPALTVTGGSVTIGSGVSLLTETAAPTILVSGGSLTVRNATVQESSGSAQAAILITGGTVDLGTTFSPGGNILNANGTGTLIENMTASPVPAVGDTLENNGVVVASNFGALSLAPATAQTANEGVPQSFNLGSLTDTVSDSQSWAVDVNWGDGSSDTVFSAASTGALGTQSHAFALPGTYTVTVTATDPVASGVAAWDLVQTFTVTVGQSIFVLDPSAGGALSLSGNATLKVPGAIVVDSSSSTAVSASGNAQITASVIDVRGKVQKSGDATFSPAPVTGTAVIADPFASLGEPSTSGMTYYGSKSFSGSSTATICSGIYSSIAVSGNAILTMNPGVYIIEGGGFSVSGNASVSGMGVTIFNAGGNYPTAGGTYRSISLTGGGTYKLIPPTSGTYAGIVIFQPRDNSKALTISSNASGMTGVIYAPATALNESGNAQLNTSIDVDTLSIGGNGVANTVTLSSPAGTVAYSPAQIRAAYGVGALGFDGTGLTIAIVDAYDDSAILQAVDAFDSQFGLTNTSPTLYQQYGPASSFLSVLNQYGQATSLPSSDPNGAGTDNWEIEEALDVEWAHAIAPGAQIILVEANSQSISDLMASAATAAGQPDVSVVSMSWGFAEGQAVFAADEAAYDSVFNVPGVTFVASTGDYGASDPEYPAFSPNVVSVGGTSLTLNADNSYNSETGWGYYSSSVGAAIGSGGGISLYEPEPPYQQGVQSLGMRTTPDVSLVADPATGAWIADSYNLDPSNPFEVVGGTSLSAPAWAGLLAIVNQGRAVSGAAALNSTGATEAQQALYSLPQSDYNTVTSGSNGYSAGAGYNLVTGLGTPVANLLVSDLVAYQGPGTSYSGPTVGPLQNAILDGNWTGSGGPTNVFSVLDALPAPGSGLEFAYYDDQSAGKSAPDRTTAPGLAGGSSAADNLVSPAQLLPQATVGAGLGITPLGEAVSPGGHEKPMRPGSLIHRAPARFASSPTFRSPIRSLVTSGMAAGSSVAGISTLDFENSAGEKASSLLPHSSRRHRA
jgi:hypothetical protein